jgi:hypothetical protein
MTPYYEHGGITIYCGDCQEVLPTPNKCDLPCTDPLQDGPAELQIPRLLGMTKEGRRFQMHPAAGGENSRSLHFATLRSG